MKIFKLSFFGALTAMCLLLSGCEWPEGEEEQEYGAWGNVSDELSWDLHDFVFTVTAEFGTGSMPDAKPSPSWYSYRNDIKKVVIEDGVTGIGKNNFKDCPRLTEATLSATVMEIGDSAFANCPVLIKVTVDSVHPPELDPDNFTASDDDVLYVPAGSRAAYAASTWGEVFSSIQEF